MFRRIILPLILVAVTFLLDTAILPIFFSHWIIPLFALLTVHALGLLMGRTNGTLFGMITGLLVDISVSTPLGLMTLFYGGLGYLGGWFTRNRRQRAVNPLTPLISAGICFSLFELGMVGYMALAAAAFSTEMLIHALIRIPLDVVLVEGLYVVYDWLIKPSRSRYASR